MHEAEGTLKLAVMAAESLFGPARVELEAVFRVDAEGRAIVVERSTEVGATLAVLAWGYLKKEFGGDVRVRRDVPPLQTSPEGGTT
jgi:hypothetical protein